MLRVGDCMKTARKEIGLTLDAVAKRCGTHKGYISGIENLKVAPPKPAILKKACQLLGIDYQRMLAYRQVDPLRMPKDLTLAVLKGVLNG